MSSWAGADEGGGVGVGAAAVEGLALLCIIENESVKIKLLGEL